MDKGINSWSVCGKDWLQEEIGWRSQTDSCEDIMMTPHLCMLTALALVILLVGPCESCNCCLCCHSQLVFPSVAIPAGWPAWANTEGYVMYGSLPDQASPL